MNQNRLGIAWALLPAVLFAASIPAAKMLLGQVDPSRLASTLPTSRLMPASGV
jgi:hypothetical protein